MMREIKFRLWDIPQERMFYGDAINYNACFGSEKAKDHGVTALMQYTGLKDKNGKEIYEGDILGFAKEEWYRSPVITKEQMDDMEDYPYTVSWLDDAACFSMPSQSDIEQYCEVIGNIYENKELIA